MKYIVSLKSQVIIDAETPEEAIEQVSDAIEDAAKRNCGDIDDEILVGATITRVQREKTIDG